MWFVSIIITIGLIFVPNWNGLNLNSTSEYLHNLCLNFTPNSHYGFMTRAIVCGDQSQIPHVELYLLRSSGLIHLIVVSASHLIFLDWFLSKLKCTFTLKIVCLFLYCLMTKLQAPALRGLISLVITQLVSKKILFWLHSEIVLVSTLCLFFAQRTFIHSFSTLLSASAALACRPGQQHILRNTSTYFILLPVLVAFSAPHPISILINTLIAPLIGFALFPLSLLSFITPISPLIDFLWSTLFSTLKHISLDTVSAQWKISIFYLWIYFFIFNCMIIIKEKYERASRLHLFTSNSNLF